MQYHHSTCCHHDKCSFHSLRLTWQHIHILDFHTWFSVHPHHTHTLECQSLCVDRLSKWVMLLWLLFVALCKLLVNQTKSFLEMNAFFLDFLWILHKCVLRIHPLLLVSVWVGIFSFRVSFDYCRLIYRSNQGCLFSYIRVRKMLYCKEVFTAQSKEGAVCKWRVRMVLEVRGWGGV